MLGAVLPRFSGYNFFAGNKPDVNPFPSLSQDGGSAFLRNEAILKSYNSRKSEFGGYSRLGPRKS